MASLFSQIIISSSEIDFSLSGILSISILYLSIGISIQPSDPLIPATNVDGSSIFPSALITGIDASVSSRKTTAPIPINFLFFCFHFLPPYLLEDFLLSTNNLCKNNYQISEEMVSNIR